MNNLGRGLQAEATYPILKVCAFLVFTQERLCKTNDPRLEPFFIPSYNLNNLDRSLLDEAIAKYQRHGPSSFRQYQFYFFPYMCLCKTSEALGGAVFEPRAIT